MQSARSEAGETQERAGPILHVCVCVCVCAHVYVGVEGGLSDFCYELHLMVQIQRELLVGVSVPDMTAKPWISVDATTDA